MGNFEPTIRNAAHVLIVRNNQILLLRKGGETYQPHNDPHPDDEVYRGLIT